MSGTGLHFDRRISRRAWLAAAAALATLDLPAFAQASEWENLFDGQALGRWKPSPFGGEGEVRVAAGEIVLERGNDMTGITWTGELVRVDYEVELEARRIDGNDFFCGLTFPVGPAYCSFIVGGWAGAVSGFSTIDGMDASENETTKVHDFEQNRWYKVRVRVTASRLQARIDDELFADVATEGRKIAIRPEVQDSRPLGIATWRTKGGIRAIRLRRLPPGEAAGP